LLLFKNKINKKLTYKSNHLVDKYHRSNTS
jgi:hypothetical protein